MDFVRRLQFGGDVYGFLHDRHQFYPMTYVINGRIENDPFNFVMSMGSKTSV